MDRLTNDFPETPEGTRLRTSNLKSRYATQIKNQNPIHADHLPRSMIPHQRQDYCGSTLSKGGHATMYSPSLRTITSLVYPQDNQSRDLENLITHTFRHLCRCFPTTVASTLSLIIICPIRHPSRTVSGVRHLDYPWSTT